MVPRHILETFNPDFPTWLYSTKHLSVVDAMSSYFYLVETPSSSSLSRTNDIHITVRVFPLYTVSDRSQFEVTKGVIRSRKLANDRQYNGEK
jgi:hypothetical protein